MGYKVIVQGDDDVTSFQWPVEEETAKSVIMTVLDRLAPRAREVHAKAVHGTVPVIESTPNEDESSEPP